MVLLFNQQNKSLLNQQVTVMKNHDETADNLLSNIYKLQNGLEEISFYNKIDWNYKHSISANTYQLYLHTLNFNNSLVRAFIKNQDIKYIVKAKAIIEDWIKENLNQKTKGNYAWYDHTVSSRIQNLLYFQANVPNKYKIKRKKFEKTIERHMAFLVKFKNYTENNHGIMMDRALVISALFLEDEERSDEYIMLAKNRIEKAILRDYSYKSIHLENSPDYHRMVTNWLNKVSKLFDDIKNPLSSKYKNILKNAELYNGIIINYNQEYPMIGDTAFGKTKQKKLHNDLVDYEAGIAVLNDRKTQATLVFNCGYKNLTHKHKDDLSFALSVEGEALFVDSGKYNYNKNDSIRKYMVSPEAHSTLYVLNKNYNLDYENKIEITSSFIQKDYKIVKGIHRGYEGIRLERTIIALNNGVYIIIDKASSDEETTYVQNFVLDDKVIINSLSTRKYLLKTKNEKEYIFQEHSPIAASKILYGQNSNAVLSKNFNKFIDTTRIEIRKKQRKSTFISSLSPSSVSLNTIEFKNSNLQLNIDSQLISLNID